MSKRIGARGDAAAKGDAPQTQTAFERMRHRPVNLVGLRLEGLGREAEIGQWRDDVCTRHEHRSSAIAGIKQLRPTQAKALGDGKDTRFVSAHVAVEREEMTFGTDNAQRSVGLKCRSQLLQRLGLQQCSDQHTAPAVTILQMRRFLGVNLDDDVKALGANSWKHAKERQDVAAPIFEDAKAVVSLRGIEPRAHQRLVNRNGRYEELVLCRESLGEVEDFIECIHVECMDDNRDPKLSAHVQSLLIDDKRFNGRFCTP
nr:hypothetical protein [Aminobacter sp. SS-2016]